MRAKEKRIQIWWKSRPAGVVALVLIWIVASGLFGGARDARAQGGIPPAGRVSIPPEARGTAEEVRLLRFGLQRSDADSVAQMLLRTAEAEYGSESLEAADAIDLLIWSFNWTLYMPLGNPRVLDRVRPLAVRALAIKEAQLEPYDPVLAPSLDNMACVLWAERDTAGAQAIANRARAIREQAYGPDSPEVAHSMRMLGHLVFDYSDPHAALELYKQALSIEEKTLPWDDLSLLETIEWVHESSQYGGAWEDPFSETMARRALRISEARLGPNQYRTLIWLESLAQGLKWTEPDEAEQLYLRGVATAEASLGPRTQTMRFHIGWANFLSGVRADPDSAVRVLRDAVNHFGDNLWLLPALGAMLANAGEESEAVVVLGRALEMAEGVAGPQSHFLSGILNERAIALMALGFYSEAERDLDRSRGILEGRPVIKDDQARFYATTLSILAELKLRTGETSVANDLYAHSIDVLTEVGHWQTMIASLHRDYGWALTRMGNPEAALAQLQRAQKLYDEVAGPQHPPALQNLYAIGETYLALGDFMQAQEAFTRCLEVREIHLGPDHPTIATTLTGLANLEMQAGDLGSARLHLERAIELQERVYGPIHPELALSLARLAEVELAQGDQESALATAIRAEEASREHFRITARAISERRALAYAGSRSSGLGCAMAVAIAEPETEAVRASWDAVIRSRGLVLDELAARRQVLDVSGDPVADSLVQELRFASNRLANLAVRGANSQQRSAASSRGARELTTDELRRVYRNGRARKESVEEALAERSLAYREGQERVAHGYQTIEDAIPERAALVAYVRHEVPGPISSQPHDLGPRWSYSVFVKCRGDPEPTLVTLGNADRIDSLVATWQRTIGSNGSVASTPLDQDYRDAGEALRKGIWDPIVPRLNDIDRVFIVPDAALHLASIATLPISSSEFLVETGPLIHYLSTERDLAAIESSTAASQGLLAVGGPAFSDRSLFSSLSGAPENTEISEETLLAAVVTRGARRSACGDFTTLHFEPLPGSAEEAQQVRDSWALQTGHDPGADALLTGKDATEAAFKNHAPNSKLLHVATHGFFLGGECRAATEISRGIGKITSGAAERLPLPAITVGNPLLLSGLALAGANNRAEAGPEEEDGILTAEEISSLDLTGVEWAVLSACETGVGEVRAGEGVFGLRRAFQIAGANTLIMSLWAVEDEETRKWMKHLYEARLVDGLDTAESVRAASLALLRERRANGESTNPFYWGAFVAAGEWR